MSRYLDLPCGTVNVYDYGGTGPLLLLVHGLGGSVANWDAVAPALTNHGHVLALDLPGFGLSPPGTDWSLETHQTAIVELIEHLGAPALLMGNSMGGLLSEMVAARRPGDVARSVASADLIGRELGWSARYGVADMIESAWCGWHRLHSRAEHARS